MLHQISAIFCSKNFQLHTFEVFNTLIMVVVPFLYLLGNWFHRLIAFLQTFLTFFSKSNSAICRIFHKPGLTLFHICTICIFIEIYLWTQLPYNLPENCTDFAFKCDRIRIHFMVRSKGLY